MENANLERVARSIKRGRFGFDKINMRVGRELRPAEIAHLQRHTVAGFGADGEPVTIHAGRFAPVYRHLPYVLTVVCPDRAAIESVIELGGIINHLEPGFDLQGHKWALVDFFDRHYVKRWHAGQQTSHHRYGSNSSKAPAPVEARHYAARPDRPAKLLQTPDAMHFELAIVGRANVRKAGIVTPRDLLAFDHRGYWLQHLRLYAVIRWKLQRWCARHGRSVDDVIASILDRGEYPGAKPYLSAQKALDEYGSRVPFLQRLDHGPIIARIDSIL